MEELFAIAVSFAFLVPNRGFPLETLNKNSKTGGEKKI
jgi:hypothetical protein